MRRILLFLMLAVATLGTRAQAVSDSLEMSILTCSPGDEVYSLYGHTALRCRDLGGSLDVAFNYGVFSFNQPHFLWHFVLGECDYMVWPTEWENFLTEYEERGSSVTQQTLNLTTAEAKRLFELLVTNCQPENRVYRYNYFYNNCTTKVRDICEQAIDGHVVYPAQDEALTFRQHIHRYTRNHPWAQEGDDVLLGADVDTLIGERESMFLPENLMRLAQQAVIIGPDGALRPLLKNAEIVLQARPQEAPHHGFLDFLLSPLGVGLMLLLVALVLMAVEWRFGTWLWGFDALLLLLRGLSGTLLCFMFFFSEHPAVGSNWLTVVLNPLAFVGLILVICAAKNGRTTRWFAFDFAILALFIVIYALGLQEFGKLVVPLTLVLVTRPISYYLFRQRKDRK